MKYVHTNIISKDWKALVQFYIDTFGCKLKPPVRKQEGDWLSRGTGVHNANLEGAHLILPGYGDDGPTLEIYQYKTVQDQDVAPANRRGFGHIAFEVNDVEEIVNAVLENGGTLAGEPSGKEVQGVGHITFVYARDPDGNLIELQHWDR